MKLHALIFPLCGLFAHPVSQPLRTPAARVTNQILAKDSHNYLEYASGQTIDELIASGQNYDPQSGTYLVSRKFGNEISPGRDLSPTLKIRLQDLSLNADAIVVGIPLDVRSALTETRKFVFSEYQVQVEKVLLNHSFNLAPTHTILVTRPGGEVNINGHIFHAIDPDIPDLKLGKAYVFFLHYNPHSQTFKSGPAETYRLDEDQAHSTQLHSDVLATSINRSTFLDTLDKAIAAIAGVQ